uniref:PB1 domain-containing protein n=1 Tax=Angiostrongylus cantonensis TaxID=6313 RepID=A0A0K0CVC1_ANGCA
MVATNGQVSMTILKARFGNDVRKTPIHHAHDLTLNDLTLMLQRIFKISSAEAIVLKYRDSGMSSKLRNFTSSSIKLRHFSSTFVEVLPDGLSRHDISAPCVEEIPLEAGAPAASAPPNNNFATPPLATSAIQDPHAPQQQGFTSQPPQFPSIPSFPHANVPPANFSPTHQQHDQPPPQPPHQFVPPQQHNVPPQMPPSNFPPAPQQGFGGSSVQNQQQQFAPPSSTFGHHPQFGQTILPSEPAPPVGVMHPPFAPPTTGFVPPPMGGPAGVPGGNPFARGPGIGGYRSSPYHQ